MAEAEAAEVVAEVAAEKLQDDQPPAPPPPPTPPPPVPPPPVSPGTKVKGVVNWFNVAKGFGFVTRDDGGGDVFVHQSDIHSEGFRSLRDQEPVEFELEEIGEDGRYKAVKGALPRNAYRQRAPYPMGGRGHPGGHMMGRGMGPPLPGFMGHPGPGGRHPHAHAYAHAHAPGPPLPHHQHAHGHRFPPHMEVGGNDVWLHGDSYDEGMGGRGGPPGPPPPHMGMGYGHPGHPGHQVMGMPGMGPGPGPPLPGPGGAVQHMHGHGHGHGGMPIPLPNPMVWFASSPNQHPTGNFVSAHYTPPQR